MGNYIYGDNDTEYKDMKIRVETRVYDKIASYAEREMRSISNSVTYILNQFAEHLDDDEATLGDGDVSDGTAAN